MNQRPIFTRDFIIVMLISFCGSLSYFTLLINMANFSTETFNATSGEAGLAVGLYVIGGLLSRLTLGKYVELVGRKKMIMLALVFAVVMSGAYFFVSSLMMLYVVRFLHGMAYGLNSTCSSDIVSKIIPAERRGEGLGYFFLSVTFSTAIGPFLGLELVKGGNYNLVFLVNVIMYSIALLLALILHVPEEKLTEEEKNNARSFSINNILQFSAIPLALVCTVFYFSYSGIHTFIAGYSETIGLAEAAGYFYLTVAAGTLISRFTTGKIYDNNGPNVIITLGFLSFIISMILFAKTDNVFIFMVTGFFMGYGISIVYAICQAIVISKSVPQRYGVTTSTFAAMVDLGTGLGPMILGLFLPILGYSDMYIACAVVAIASLLMYWMIHGVKVAKHGL